MVSHSGYRGIFVHIFCLINICSSLSDEANKIKPLNIERAKQFQLSLKIWSGYTKWFRRNSLLKTQNFAKNVCLINFFATQQFCSFCWLVFPSALSTFEFSSCRQPRLLWVKSYANEEKCKQLRQQRFAYHGSLLVSSTAASPLLILCLYKADSSSWLQASAALSLWVEGATPYTGFPCSGTFFRR